jgi:predicted RNA-binding protein with TRAM domain
LNSLKKNTKKTKSGALKSKEIAKNAEHLNLKGRISIVNLERGMLSMSYGRRQGGSYEGRRDHGKGFKRCPVEMGKEYEVDVTEMSRQKESIARIQGFVVFVANAKPGDHLKIKITRIGGMNANAEIVK